ncbi:hypothetical protein DUI87_31101 [Hirundo rustica rustica]|uniref:Uncharacterized protein n=1 Tax=Hirundo rustica rustica TaxID=333673 RepID=A0A3M0J106_HIRRU|nr:hypothetical protein DUI87_31101 [Hirundo rustica rustica]
MLMSTTPAAEAPLAHSLPPEAKGEAKDNKPPHVVSAGPEHAEPAPLGELLASRDSSAQAGKAEGHESTDGARRAPELRWKQLSVAERKRHSSRGRVFEVATETVEELQPQRDLLKEEVPLAGPKVCGPQRPAHRGLEKLLQEFSRQGHTLSQVCREKAALAQENAALGAQLAATERNLRGLSEQLVREGELAKQPAGGSAALIRAGGHQEPIWKAKLTEPGYVRRLRGELQAVRCLHEQQREEMAQQLRWAGEQYSKALRLWQSAREEETRKLQANLERQLEQQRLEVREQLELQANFLAELQCRKAAVLDRMGRLQGKLTKRQQQVEQLRLELKKERENGQGKLQEAQRKMKAMEKRHKREMERMLRLMHQHPLAKQMRMDAGSAAAAASFEEASSPQPENSSTNSSSRSSEEREKQCLEQLTNAQPINTPGVLSIGLNPCTDRTPGKHTKALVTLQYNKPSCFLQLVVAASAVLSEDNRRFRTIYKALDAATGRAILPCVNIKQSGERMLRLFPIYLQRECRVMRLLMLRCLMVLCKRSSMANTIWALTECLIEVLKDEDREVVWMTLSLLNGMFQNRDVPIASSVALLLVEALQPRFNNVKLCATPHPTPPECCQELFSCVFSVPWPAVLPSPLSSSDGVVGGEGKRPLKDCMHQCLLPFFYHMYNENKFVAEASWETLLQATIFLKKWNLEQLLKKEEQWRFGECLLEEERDRANGYLRQNPQKSM